MKLFKLWVHQQNFSEDDLILNPKEFPNEREGDILEIHHPDEDNTRLLLQIKSINPEFQQKDTISIEQSVANIFQLRTYWDVEVTKVEPKDVSVDMVELLFKDQFVTRSEMWRFSKQLVGSCVYITKKLSHFGVRAQVNEIWTKGEKVSCGVISDDTRVVFRSSSTKMYLFIQMSKEMWDFDSNGDLYIEKAINGFCYELFTKWKELKAHHDVSIILFSKTFYNAQSLEDFPEDAQGCVQKDPYGRFYEDFYQVVALSDRRDDWIPMLVTLKHCFNQYPKLTNCCDKLKGTKIKGKNSSSYEGNFLEAINLAMNAFERHHIDRNFSRTGQTVIIVAPGSGVFEVDREMTSITKQRLLDSGVSIDLVCLAEQPLHTVPLFKFFNKTLGLKDKDIGDDYNIPHWMNHNFYTSPKTRNKTGNIAPRIKIPDAILNSLGKNGEHEKVYTNFAEHCKTEVSDSQLPDRVDYDEYDAKIFRNPLTHSTLKGWAPRGTNFRRTRSALDMQRMAKSMSKEEPIFHRISSPPRGVSSYEDMEISASFSALTERDAPSIKTPDNRETHILSSSLEYTSHGVLASLSENMVVNGTSHEIIRPIPRRFAVGSAGASRHEIPGHSRPQRTLINPFKPNEIPCNWTCNRQRWSHVFPKGPGGEVLHRHYEKLSPAESSIQIKTKKSRSVEEAALAVVAARTQEISEAQFKSITEEQLPLDALMISEENEDTYEDNAIIPEPSSGILGHFSPISEPTKTSQNTTPRRRSQLARFNLYRGMEKTPDEYDWTAAVKTSVDWKSLTCPALLPLTSYFSPSKQTLETDYLESNYNLLIEEEEEYTEEKKTSGWGKQESLPEEDSHGARRGLSAEMLFMELVSQRIRKGFQLTPLKGKPAPNKAQSIAGTPAKSDYQEFFLSIGRNSHKLSLTSHGVTVTRYRPRHQIGSQPMFYRYRLWIPQRKVFEPNDGEFRHEEMENYNWNYLDQYLCEDPDFNVLIESLHYWKARYLLLPFSPLSQRQIKESGREEKKKTSTQQADTMDGIMRFLEVLNRIKRHQTQKTPTTPKDRKQSDVSLPTRRISKQQEHKASRPISCELTVSRENSSVPSNPLTNRSRSSSGIGDELGSADSHASPSRELPGEHPKSVDESPVKPDKGKLSAESSLESVAEAMLDPGKGMTFLPEVKGLKPTSFLSVEAISWILHNVEGINAKEQATRLCQKLLERGFINQASDSTAQKLVEGFVIFYFTPKSCWREKTEDMLEVTDRPPVSQPDILHAFQNDWFEVAIWPTKPEKETPEFLAPDLEIVSSLAGSSVRKLHSESGHGCGPAYKFVTLDADPSHKSQRPESCTVRYHGDFSSLHAFEIELHWIAATGCIVSDMVSSWSRKAPSCGFHLVPVPVSPFPDRKSRNVDPFRLPVFIQLNLSNFTADPGSLFEEFEYSTRSRRMFLFLEAILQRFGFIRDKPHGSTHVSSRSMQVTPVQCREKDYVHTSGVAFVRIPRNWDEDEYPVTSGLLRKEKEQLSSHTWGFNWMQNYMLTKRWRSAATGDNEAAERLRGELEGFCADKEGVLSSFWESCQEAARKDIQKRIKKEEAEAK